MKESCLNVYSLLDSKLHLESCHGKIALLVVWHEEQTINASLFEFHLSREVQGLEWNSKQGF